MKVVVTGGAGFIGANLCRALDGRDEIEEIVALDDLSTGSRENLVGTRARLAEGSILDDELVAECVSGASAVVHLAARPSVPRSIEDPVATHRVNTDGTVEVLEAVRREGTPSLVVASSSSVYGSNPVLPKSEDLATRPVSPYAASKLATESYALSYGASFGLDVLALRFFNVFGPLQPAGHAYAAVVPAFVSALVEGRPLPVHGDGTQTRDFTYVGTVCEVLVQAVLRRVRSESPVNLAFGTRTDLLSVIDLLGELEGGGKPEIDWMPARAGDVPHSQADSSLLQSLFPEVKPVPLEKGLQATIDWYRHDGRNSE